MIFRRSGRAQGPAERLRWWIVIVVIVAGACGPGVSVGPAPEDAAPGEAVTPDRSPDTKATPDTKPAHDTKPPSDTKPPPDSSSTVDCWCSPNSEHVNKERAYLCANMSKYCAKGSDNDLGWYPLNAATETCVKQTKTDYFVKVSSCPR
jgi:hypothetical protein